MLRDLSLQLNSGEVLGLVGHSGCGKSSLALAILGLLPMKGGKPSGSILFNDRELLTLKEREWRKLRGKEISFVPQSAMSSLNPALRIGTQLAEAWKLHANKKGQSVETLHVEDPGLPWATSQKSPIKGSRGECEEALLRGLENVSLPPTKEFLQRYPAEISVGQAQRVLIAMAILHRPALLIADEPTSALDAITQSEILALFSRLNRKLGMSILFISHDLLFASSLCHRIAILHGGQIVECDTPRRIFFHPSHPFTEQLVAALPSTPTAIKSQTEVIQ